MIQRAESKPQRVALRATENPSLGEAWAFSYQRSGNMHLAGFQDFYGPVTAMCFPFPLLLSESFNEVILSVTIVYYMCGGMAQVSLHFRLRGTVLRELHPGNLISAYGPDLGDKILALKTELML